MPSPLASSGSQAPPPDGLPERIGAYRVVRRLATGGTSDVLLARAEGPLLFVIVGLSACGGAAGAFFWLRSHPGASSSPSIASEPMSAATPTSTPSATASTLAPTTTPTATETTTAATAITPEPAPASTTGQVTVPPSRAGHRVWIDGHMVGQSPGSFSTGCGWHRVRVGSAGHDKNVNVPCGSDVEVR